MQKILEFFWNPQFLIGLSNSGSNLNANWPSWVLSHSKSDSPTDLRVGWGARLRLFHSIWTRCCNCLFWFWFQSSRSCDQVVSMLLFKFLMAINVLKVSCGNECKYSCDNECSHDSCASKGQCTLSWPHKWNRSLLHFIQYLHRMYGATCVWRDLPDNIQT